MPIPVLPIRRPQWLGLLAFVVLLGACGNLTAEEHLQRAQEALAQGEVQAAIIDLKNAVQKNRDFGEARSLLGQAHLRAGDAVSALKELERAQDLGLTDDATMLALYRTKLALNQYSEVIGALEEAQTLEPPFAVTLAAAYLAAGDVEKAKPLMQQGLHLVEGLLGMAQIAESENDSPRAISYLEQALAKDPGLVRGWVFKGEVELGEQAYDAALASFTRGAALPGGEVAGQLGIVRAHLLLEDLTQARSAADILVARAPELAPGQYLNGLIAFREGDREAAENALLVVQKNAPQHAPTLYLMGLLKMQEDQMNQAQDYLQRYLTQDAGNPSVRKLLASIHDRQGDSEAVVDTLRPVLEQAGDPQIWALMGSAQLKLGDPAAATASFQRAVALAPDEAPFRNQLALSLISSGDDQGALSELDTAVDLDSNQFQSDFILVMLKLRDGDLAGAREAVDNVVAKSPENPLGHNMRGAVLLAQDEADAARQSFEKALALDAAYYPAAQSLANIAERAGEIAAARQLYEDAVAANPQNEAAALGLVEFTARHSPAPDVLAMLDDVIERLPGSVRARIGQLRLLLVSRDLERAERAAKTLVEMAPELPDSLILKAEVDLATGDAAEARQTINRLQVLSDRFQNNKQVLGALGALQLRIGNLTLARQHLEAAVAFDDPPVLAIVSAVRLELMEGNPQAAASQLAALTEAGIDTEEVQLLKGDTLTASGNREAALEHFKTMAERGSRQGTSRFAALLAGSGRTAEAMQVMRNWLRAHPEDSGFKLMLANLGIQQGDNDGAKAQYESMMPTNNPIVLNNLAWLYMEANDPRAVEVARQAYAALPGNPDVIDTLGWVLVRTGEAQEGLTLLRESARAKPDDPTVQYHLGVALHRTGDVPGAKIALQRALTLGDFDDRGEAETLLQSI